MVGATTKEAASIKINPVAGATTQVALVVGAIKAVPGVTTKVAGQTNRADGVNKVRGAINSQVAGEIPHKAVGPTSKVAGVVNNLVGATNKLPGDRRNNRKLPGVNRNKPTTNSNPNKRVAMLAVMVSGVNKANSSSHNKQQATPNSQQ